MDENGARWEICLFIIELMVEPWTMDENEISWKGNTKSSILKDLSPPQGRKKIKTFNIFIIYFAFLKQCTSIG
jgi:hypothetical protein